MYFYFPIVNMMEGSRYNIPMREFYNSMKRLPSQNIMLEKIKVNDSYETESFSLSHEKIDSKVIKKFEVCTDKDFKANFKSLQFSKKPEFFNYNDLIENYDIKQKINFKMEYKEEFVNDSKIWKFYDKIISLKFSLAEKELINKELNYFDFEDEKEYLLKVKEVYEEFYNY